MAEEIRPLPRKASHRCDRMCYYSKINQYKVRNFHPHTATRCFHSFFAPDDVSLCKSNLTLQTVNIMMKNDEGFLGAKWPPHVL